MQYLFVAGSVTLIGVLFVLILKSDQKQARELMQPLMPDDMPLPVGSPHWQHNRISRYFDSQL